MKALATLLLGLTLSLPVCAQEPAQEQAELPLYPRVEVTTNLGDFTIELYTKRAPLHVRNFVDYVNSGFYDGTVFHRVIENFVVQGGGYDANYKLKETGPQVPNEAGNGLTNRRGFVGMARTGDPHSADSQFYINLRDNNELNPRITRWGYTVFGQVVEGIEVIDEMAASSTGSGPLPELGQDVPVKPIVIRSARMIAPSAESAPSTQQ